MKKSNKVTFLTQAAVIAAIYVVLTIIFAPFSFGEVQVRISEALTVLPFFTPAAIPGLFVGCIIANLFGGAIPKKSRFLAPLPPIIANTLIVPFVLYYGYGVNLPIPFMMLTVGIGEVLSCGVIGLVLQSALKNYSHVIFRDTAKA